MKSETLSLLVFCKQPKLYQGKQRLAATLGAEAALDVAQGLLQCALEDACDWKESVVLSPSVAEDVLWASELMPGAEIIAQPQGNLGDRILIVDRKMREQGHNNILIIGTDAPVLSPAYYQAVSKALTESDVVLSAASDGGVTLMASSKPWPDISDLPWSTELLNEKLFERCETSGLSVSYIQPSYDIDHEQDLHKLLIDLQSDPRPARQALLARVQTILNKDESYV